MLNHRKESIIGPLAVAKYISPHIEKNVVLNWIIQFRYVVRVNWLGPLWLRCTLRASLQQQREEI